MALVVAAALAATGSAKMPFAYLHSGMLLPLVLVLVVTLDHEGFSWLGGPRALALGRASYATYVLHVPLFLLAARFDSKLWSEVSHVAAYAMLLLAASLVGHAAVEEPARRSLTRWLSRASSPSPRDRS